MTVGALALDTFWVHAGEEGGDAHADCPAVNAILQFVRGDLLFLLEPSDHSQTGKEMDEQGKREKGGCPEGCPNA